MKTYFRNYKLFGNSGHRQFIFGLVILLFVSYFVVFLHLDRLTLRVWDESCYLINAQNMLKNPHLFLVYNFNELPERFCTKPPLYVWIAAISLKIMPNNPELAIRMPAALFALFSILLLYAFGYYYLKNFASAMLSAVILLSSVGFFQWHIARTGDTDTTFVFWSLFCCLSFFVYTVELGKKQMLALLLFGLGLLFATLTKGPGIIMLLPSFFMWLLLNKKLVATCKKPSFWIVFGTIATIVFTWYFMREQLDPGFLQAVWDMEFKGRFEIIEPQTHEGNHALFFLFRMFDQQYFMPWILFLFPALHIVIRKEKTKEIQLLKFIILVWFFCILSISQSKTMKDWYDAIWYPLMALITAVSIIELIKKRQITLSRTIFYSLLLFSCWPLSLIIKKNMFEKETQYLKPFLTALRAEKYKTEKLFVYDQNFDCAMFFYIQEDQRKGFKSELWQNNIHTLPNNIDVITINWKHEEEIRNHFVVKEIESMQECKLFHLLGRTDIQ
ncbi:MAG: glycosyltransferase family 39 protein [Bacteroidota bacterium]|nr:glycosyltransferase family 39 protein [Bacteroidota bacterium]